MGVLQRSGFTTIHIPLLQRLKPLTKFWLLGSMILVNLTNYGFASVLGRGLGPGGYAEINLILTLFGLASLVSSFFQVQATRFSVSRNNHAQLRQLRRIAWIVGALNALLCAGLVGFWQSLFGTSPTPLLLLGLGLICYYPLGVERGIMQSQAAFGRLAGNLLLETLLRFSGAVIVVELGLGVSAASGAFTASLLLAWGLSYAKPGVTEISDTAIQLQPAAPIGLRMLGQGLILNSDLLLVTLWFSSQIAGQYAALALIGRIGFFISSTVASLVFAKLLRADKAQSQQRQAFWQSLGMIIGIGIIFSLTCWAMPQLLVKWLFGSAYLPIGGVLWRYAAIASGYAVVNFLVAYQVAQQRQSGVWLTLGAGIGQIVLLSAAHQTINHVLNAQALVMLVLLATVCLSEWLEYTQNRA
ncbi:MATE family efflux transporter [Herpetosiphon geysericola]|uniref:Polysaccharide biosynthesis protein n=1 Tax=Herpetosiphon geysericola TaxID=70996 RepID=A0A0P6Y4Q5_9CHLR|nr:hypothetical protein [Herpetosiphon geysericola]KPL80139.1 hypothetical protein SE18_23995 [Herpetosiphon geysericola]